jgi:hypothetical protein
MAEDVKIMEKSFFTDPSELFIILIKEFPEELAEETQR